MLTQHCKSLHFNNFLKMLWSYKNCKISHNRVKIGIAAHLGYLSPSYPSRREKTPTSLSTGSDWAPQAWEVNLGGEATATARVVSLCLYPPCIPSFLSTRSLTATQRLSFGYITCSQGPRIRTQTPSWGGGIIMPTHIGPEKNKKR